MFGDAEICICDSAAVNFVQRVSSFYGMLVQFFTVSKYDHYEVHSTSFKLLQLIVSFINVPSIVLYCISMIMNNIFLFLTKWYSSSD